MGRAQLTPAPAVLGFRAHSGWAAVVAVSGDAVVLRARIEMTSGEGFRARQPYHAAEEMKLAEANLFLQRTEEAATCMASAAIKDTLAQLTADGYVVNAAAVLLGSAKPLPELAKILAAHPLIHTAEGVFYREVLCNACAAHKLPVARIREREVLQECAAALHLPLATLQSRLAAMGKPMGPPWTQDEKLATAAALSFHRENNGS